MTYDNDGAEGYYCGDTCDPSPCEDNETCSLVDQSDCDEGVPTCPPVSTCSASVIPADTDEEAQASTQAFAFVVVFGVVVLVWVEQRGAAKHRRVRVSGFLTVTSSLALHFSSVVFGSRCTTTNELRTVGLANLREILYELLCVVRAHVIGSSQCVFRLFSWFPAFVSRCFP